MTIDEAMETRKKAYVRIDPESPDSWWMSPSGSNSWCSIGDMKRILNSYDVLAAEVERLTRDNKNLIVSCGRHAELYVIAAQRAETMRADNEVLTASLAQARAERDGYRNELERGMKG